MSRPIQRVAVVGRDAAAWLSALVLHTAFGRSGVAVEVIELPSRLQPVDVYDALPTLSALHKLLGLDEDDILKACRGLQSLGQRFSNWSGPAPAFLHAYDRAGIAINNVDFIHYWVRARQQGLNVQLEEFSIGAAAAKAGRRLVFSDATETFSNAGAGCHLDAQSYVSLIRDAALRQGVLRTTGEVQRVESRGETIDAVVLADERRVEADFYVDASDDEARLIALLPGGGQESWSAWFGCDRMLAATGKPLKPAPAFAQITAFANGWVGLYPLGDRTAVRSVYSSAAGSDQSVLRMTALLSGLALGDAAVSELRPGARRRPWIGNCVAIGRAAAALEPLDAVELHLIQAGLTHLMTFFPVDADSPAEAVAYNGQMARQVDNIRDFQVAHYLLNQRRDEPFWDRVRGAEPPSSLAYKRDLFAARGVMASFDDETFDVADWISIFVGHGLIPRAYDPLADGLPGPDHIRHFQRMLAFVADQVRDMPSMEAEADLSAPVPQGAPF